MFRKHSRICGLVIVILAFLLALMEPSGQVLAVEDSGAEAYRLGQKFEAGEGVAQSDSLAWGWYQRAANLGNVEAEARVAFFYEQGRGVPMSPAQALKWYATAAQHGHITSMVRVGEAYRDGRGVKADLAKAITWLRRAASLGDAEAREALVALRERGVLLEGYAPPPPEMPQARP
ncbi:MAG: tetratricopeptide repeat protein [Alphaproteobacteria bacterium]